MFGTLGGPEVILILVVALIVFGPRRLPEIGKSMGKMLAEFRKASNDFKRTIDDELEAEKVRETQAQLPVAAPPLDIAPSSTPVSPPEADWRPPYDTPPSTTEPLDDAAVEPPVTAALGAGPEATPAGAGSEPPAISGASTPSSPEPRIEAPVEAVVSRNRSADE